MLDTFDSLVAGLPMLIDTDDGPSLEDLLTGASSPPQLRTRQEAAGKIILGTSDLFLDSVPDLWMADGAGDSAGGCGNGGLLDGGGLQRSQQQQTHRTLLPAAAEESRVCSGAATPPAAAIAAPEEALGSHVLMGGESNAAALSRGQGLRLQQQQAAGPAAGIAGGAAATACGLGAALDAASSRMRIVSSSSQALFHSTASPAVCLDRSASSTASAGAAAPAAPAPPVTPAAAAIARLMSYTQPPPPAPAHAAGPVRVAAGSSRAALLLSPRAVAEMPARYDGCLSVPPATFSSTTTSWNPWRPIPTPAEVLAAATAAAADGGGGLAPTRFGDCLFGRAAGAHCISDPVAMPSLRIASSAEVSALKANGGGFQHAYPGGGGFGGGSALATASSRHASCSAMFLEQQQQQQLQQSSLPQLPAAGFGDGELSHRRLLPLTAANPLGGNSQRRHDGGGGFLLPGPGQRRGAAVDGMDDFLDDWGAGPAGCWGAPLMPPPALCAPPLLPNDDGGNDGGKGAAGGSGSSHVSSLHSAWSTGVLLRQQGSAPAHVASSSLQQPHGSPAPPVAAAALHVHQQQDWQPRLIAVSPATVAAAAAAGGDAASSSGHGSGLGSSAEAGPWRLGPMQQQQQQQQVEQQLQQLQQPQCESLLHRRWLPDGGGGAAPAAGGGATRGPSREPARWPPVAVKSICCPPCQQLPAGFTPPLTPPLDTMDRMLTSLEQIKLQQFQQQERRQQQQQQQLAAAGWSGPQAQQQWLPQQPQPLGHQAHTATAPPLRIQLEMEMESLAGQGPLLSTPGGENTTSHSALVVAPLPHDFAATCLLGQQGMGSAADDAGGACWVRGSSSRVPLDRSGKATYEPSAAVAAVPPAAAGGAAPRGIERQLDRPAPLGPQQQQAAQQEGADACCARRGGHLELRGIGASGTYACGVEDHVMPPLGLQQQQRHLQQQLLPRPINPTDVEKREPPADGCEGAAVARRAEERLQLLNSGSGLGVLHGSTSSGRVPSEYLEPAAAAEKQGDGDSRALPTKARDAAASAVDGGLPRKKRPGAGDTAAQLLARAKAQATVDWPLPAAAEAKGSGRSAGARRVVKEEDEDEEWMGDEGPPVAVALGEHPLQQEPTLEQLKRYYEQPIKAAARALGISLTCFKGVCRRLGVPRWPGRKLQTLKKMRDTLLQAGAGGAVTIECAGGAVISPAEQTDLIAKIALNISDIYADACTPMYPEFTRVRQLQYKTRSVARQGRRGGGSGGGGAGGKKGAEGSDSSDGEGTVTRRTTGGAGVGKGGGGVVKRRRRFSERYSVSSDKEASEVSEEPDAGEVPQED